MIKKILALACTLLIVLSLVSCNLMGIRGGFTYDRDLLSTISAMIEVYSYYDYEVSDEQIAKAVVAAISLET